MMVSNKVIWEKGQKALINTSGALDRGSVVTVNETYTQAEVDDQDDVTCLYQEKSYLVNPAHLTLVIWDEGDQARVIDGKTLPKGTVVSIAKPYTRPQYDDSEPVQCKFEGKQYLIRIKDLA